MNKADMNGNKNFYKTPRKSIKWKNLNNIIKKMNDTLNYYMNNVDKIHVYFACGNEKTGLIPSVSLLPIIDCENCMHCMNGCYDVRHDIIYKECMERRAINSAIHREDQERFWKEIKLYCQSHNLPALRFNVGGDFNEKDFIYLASVAAETPSTDYLFFTKNYDGINAAIDKIGSFPTNVHAIMSAWNGVQMNNVHHLPESHVIDADGNTTLGNFDRVLYCQGNCTECKMRPNQVSCWTIHNGEKVLFPFH